MRKLPVIIAVAAISGGGKTTIAKQLNQKLENVKTLYFDNYNFEGPDDIINWLDRGANYEEWNLAPLVKDLEILLSESLDYIVLDYPFAYKHTNMSKFINIAVFIDTPLDIAMARRITRDFKNKSVDDILSEMTNYTAQGRRGYIEMLKTIKPDSDIVIDGTLAVFETVNKILQSINSST